jgi:hypothetical protein
LKQSGFGASNSRAGAKSVKIEALKQNLVREDTDDMIDPVNIGCCYFGRMLLIEWTFQNTNYNDTE